MPKGTSIDRSLAFTALLELMPGYGQLDARDGEKLTTALTDAWHAAPDSERDMFAFARNWIAARQAEPEGRSDETARVLAGHGTRQQQAEYAAMQADHDYAAAMDKAEDRLARDAAWYVRRDAMRDIAATLPRAEGESHVISRARAMAEAESPVWVVPGDRDREPEAGA